MAKNRHTRCDEVIVLLVVRTHDDLGRTLDARQVGLSNGAGGVVPVTVFRNAETQNFWGWVDKAVAAMARPSPAPPAAPPAPVPLTPRRGRRGRRKSP